MSIKTYIRNIFSRSAGSTRAGVPWFTSPDVNFGGDALAVSAVFACVKVLSESVAIMPLHQMRLRGDVYERDRFTALNYLLNVQPSPELSAFDFRRRILVEMLLDGNAYVVPFIDSATLQPYRLALCTRGSVSYDNASGTYTVADGVAGIYGTYQEGDILHIKGCTLPQQPNVGISVLSYAKSSIGITRAGGKEMYNRFATGGTVRGLLTGRVGTRGLDEYRGEELNKLAVRLSQGFGGGDQPTQGVVGDVELKQISMSAADMQFLEAMKFSTKEICRFFNVPPSFIHEDAATNYKGSENAMTMFLNCTLNPYLCAIENEFTRKLIPESLAPYRHFAFDRSAYYATDLKTRAAYQAQILAQGGTVNEGRRANNLPPVEGGDIPLVSANLRPLSEITTPRLQNGKE